MTKFLLKALIGATLHIGIASAVDIHQEISIAAKPEKVWKQISDFCSIQYWAPKGVPKCTQFMTDNVHYRTLTMGDGSKIEEKLVDITDTSLSYSITKATSPIKDHKATMALSYQPKTGNTILSWDVRMTVESDIKMQEAIEGAFQKTMKDGLQTIKEKVKNSH